MDTLSFGTMAMAAFVSTVSNLQSLGSRVIKHFSISLNCMDVGLEKGYGQLISVDETERG